MIMDFQFYPRSTKEKGWAVVILTGRNFQFYPRSTAPVKAYKALTPFPTFNSIQDQHYPFKGIFTRIALSILSKINSKGPNY